MQSDLCDDKCNDNTSQSRHFLLQGEVDIGFLEMPWNIWNILPMACAGPMIQAV